MTTIKQMENRMLDDHEYWLRHIAYGTPISHPSSRARRTLLRWKAIIDGQLTDIGQQLLAIADRRHGKLTASFDLPGRKPIGDGEGTPATPFDSVATL